MVRRIELWLPKSQTRAVAELLDDRAPKTCEAIWSVLAEPVERTLLHAILSGENVLFYNLPPIAQSGDLPLENHKVRAGAGELMFFFMPAGQLAGLHGLADWLDPSGNVYEVAFSYGESDFMVPTLQGWRGSHWATVVENRTGFAAGCRATRFEGTQPIVLRRIEDTDPASAPRDRPSL
ncbi:MAG: hypothetical protein QOF01_2897 [Thermomicrobiales bacterium]|nr:hypothetical protein [Thermomicrobiales bacterium]